MIDESNDVPNTLRPAVEALRDPVEPSPEFRGRVLRSVRSERRWSLRPWQALAAGILCMLAGGGVTFLAQHRVPRDPVIEVLPVRSGIPVRFRLVAPGASTVAVVGDFNQWNPTALPMRRAADGRTWEIEVELTPGRYAYSFLVDGALALDPTAPRTGGDDYGTPNSVLMVKGS